MPIIKAAIAHKGAAFIDVISPCVMFNNHAGSTKSFDFVREHNEAVNRLDFISSRMPIEVKYEPGTVEIVEQHDGSKLALRKLDADYELMTAPPRSASCSITPQRSRSSPACSMWRRTPEDLHGASRHGQNAAQCIGRERPVPRSIGAG